MKIILRKFLLGLLRGPTTRSRARPTAPELWPADHSVWRPVREWSACGRRGFTSSPTPRQQAPQQQQRKEKRHGLLPRVNPLSIGPAQSKVTRITILELDGELVAFDNVFLRDACTCPRCVHPSTQQKLFETSDISYDVRPKVQSALDGGTLRIEWADDIPSYNEGEPHISHYTIDFLRGNAELRYKLRKSFNDRRYVLWDKRLVIQDMLWIDYKDYMTSDQKLYEAVRHLSLYGLIFLRGLPETPKQNAVEGVAERIGNIKNTFYGKTWDVMNVKGAKNIAYTSLNLGLHMDLLYFESPPGLQFLHCIRNSVTGGSSLFADSFRAVTTVRMSSEQLWKSLCTFPVTYHYKNDGHHYHYSRPTVVLENNTYLRQPRIDHTNWAPSFQAPFDADTSGHQNSEFRRYISAAKSVAAALNDPSSQFELTLQEGECAVFNNRRVVHGRRGFDPTNGDRWLRGTYVDVDAFLSRYRMLSQRYYGVDEKKKTEYGISALG